MKVIADYVVSWTLIGALHCLIFYYSTVEEMRKVYYDMFGIPYTSHRDKFYTFYKRANK